MELTVAEKIRIVLGRQNKTLTDLAEILQMSRQNLNNKMKRDNFSEKEIEDIARALNLGFEINFIMEDGKKI
ncbi:helix-turn-helix domain-containing protein [Rummeliibacillus stabekisii]|uniref:Transcriptional regulator n=1 Tax=Rummeliibacillus stabekisii TaxID=241244 RepID=A0A143HBT1_9BACL|nr:helix-turn-helix domain-containing protein [Rummeliibacillus stabekisii]AMW99184.1 transcriptional regulator [Rummeliibacillus stabekisii]